MYKVNHRNRLILCPSEIGHLYRRRLPRALRWEWARRGRDPKGWITSSSDKVRERCQNWDSRSWSNGRQRGSTHNGACDGFSDEGSRREKGRRPTGTLLIVWGLSQQGEGLGSWEWTSDIWSDSFLLFSSLSQTLKLFNLCLWVQYALEKISLF